MLRGLLILGAIAIFGAAALNASTTFDFRLFGMESNGDVISGTAVFAIVDDHHFTITVSNTTSMQDLTQLLTGLDFTLAGADPALASSSGEFIQFNGTDSLTALPSGTTGWGLEWNGSQWLLCAQCGGNGSGIVGSGPYPWGLTGTYLDNPVVFEFTTDSGLTTDGSDPFSKVSLAFNSGFGITWLSSDGSNAGGGLSGQVAGAQNTGAGGQSSTGGGDQTPGGGDPGSNNGSSDPSNGGNGTSNGGTGGTSPSSGVPEPAGLILCGAGLLGLVLATRFTRTV